MQMLVNYKVKKKTHYVQDVFPKGPCNLKNSHILNISRALLETLLCVC